MQGADKYFIDSSTESAVCSAGLRGRGKCVKSITSRNHCSLHEPIAQCLAKCRSVFRRLRRRNPCTIHFPGMHSLRGFSPAYSEHPGPQDLHD